MKRQVYTLCVALLMLPVGSVLAVDDTLLRLSDSGFSRQNLPFGHYVRITKVTKVYGGASWQYGTLAPSTADSLVLRGASSAGGDQAPTVIALSSLDRMQIRNGHTNHSTAGFMIGGVVGVGVGIAAGIGIASSFSWGDESESTAGAATMGGLLGLVVGGGLGAIIGTAIETDKWEEVPLNPVHIGLIPQPGGRQAFGLTMRF